MAKITIDKAQPGMVVNANVENDKGMTLLQPGTVLTEALISRLQKWNVQNISIHGDDVASQSPANTDPKVCALDEALLEKLTKKFQTAQNDPLMKILFEAVKTHYQNQEKKPA